MGNFIQQILGFLTSPVGFIIIFGLIGGLGKLGNWLSHERAKRAAALARAKRDDENLRTGRPITVDSSLRPAPAQAGSGVTQADRQRALQEQRAAQLRALQQKRLEELRAKRAAQGAGQSAPGARRTPAQNAPAPTQAQAAESARATPAQHSTTRRPPPPQRMQPPQRPAQQARPQQPVQRTPRPAPRPVPGATPPATRPVEATEIGAGRERSASPYQIRVAPSVGLGPLLASEQDLRRAVVLAELLGPPLADRDPGNPGLF